MIQYPISNDYIKVKLDVGNGGEKTELRQKVIFHVSLYELHKDMINKDATGFSMEYEKMFICITSSSL